MNKKTWKPYAAIVLILLYGVDIFWLSRFCVYYFGEWGIPMYEGLLCRPWTPKATKTAEKPASECYFLKNRRRDTDQKKCKSKRQSAG